MKKNLFVIFVIMICMCNFTQSKVYANCLHINNCRENNFITARIFKFKINLLQDNTPPIITLNFNRGFKNIVNEEFVELNGTITDESKISKLIINDIPVKLSANNTFRVMQSLIVGENIIIIKAIDIYKNKGEKIIKIQRIDECIINEIEWNTPYDEYLETGSNKITVSACFNVVNNLKYYSLYVNNELIKKIAKQSVRFRGNCKVSIDEVINLRFGENYIKIIAQTDNEIIESERIVNYKLTARNYHALLIAVEQYYNDKLNDLSEPVNDAEKLKQVLINNYTFDEENITVLKNSTRSDIIGALHKLRTTIDDNDNLLIFYAGHGYWDVEMKTGYWLPCNAEPENPANWLSNSDLTGYLSVIKSKHTLLIADACFGGGIFKTRSAFNSTQAIEKLYQMTSRKAMTSGTLKEVPDKSVFLEYLIKNLNKNTEQYITAEQLFSDLRISVINNSPNVPQYGTIQNTGDEGGDFLFIRKNQLADEDIINIVNLNKNTNIGSINQHKNETKELSTTTIIPIKENKTVTDEINITKRLAVVTDIEGNIYQTVQIGNQVWMAANLKNTKYNDGTNIPNITDNNAWIELTSPAYCWYENDATNKKQYGALYNWYVIETNKLCPSGWHIPVATDWKTLELYLGMRENDADDTGLRGRNEGAKLKSIDGWHNDGNGTNESGFNALPAGCRDESKGLFENIGTNGYWWSATSYDNDYSGRHRLSYYYGRIYRSNYDSRKFGYSVRCVKD